MPPEPRRRTTSQRPISAPGPRLLGLIAGPLARSIGDGVPAATAPADDSFVAPGSRPGGRDSTVGSAAIAGGQRRLMEDRGLARVADQDPVAHQILERPGRRRDALRRIRWHHEQRHRALAFRQLYQLERLVRLGLEYELLADESGGGVRIR